MSLRSLQILLASVLVLATVAVCQGLRADAPKSGSELTTKNGQRRPVILVPGITGSSLRDRNHGAIAWGDGPSLLGPRDAGHGLALPLGGERRLEAFRVIEQIRLLRVARKNIYGPIIRAFEERGYRSGSLSSPKADQDFFAFAYDWRLSNEETVEELYDQLERLRQLRGVESLGVALICQSNGGHICRYLAKFGKATLEEAEAGRARPSATIRVEHIAMVGASNGGSMKVLRSLDRGRRYVPLVGRRMQPETLFTFPTLYQALPAYTNRFFVDEEGNDLDLDLYDARTWKDYGLSIFDAKAGQRLSKSSFGKAFGSEEQRMDFLARVLDQARRLQKVLLQDVPGFDDIRYDMIQNRKEPTPEKAVLVAEPSSQAQRWSLLFTGDKELKRNKALDKRVTTLGDGHATNVSQDWLSEQERTFVPCEPFNVKGTHFGIVLNPRTLERLVELLADEDAVLDCRSG